MAVEEEVGGGLVPRGLEGGEGARARVRVGRMFNGIALARERTAACVRATMCSVW